MLGYISCPLAIGYSATPFPSRNPVVSGRECIISSWNCFLLFLLLSHYLSISPLLPYEPCLSLFSFFSKGFPTLCFFLPTLPNYPSCLPPFLFLFHVLLPSPFPSCSSLLYSPLNSSWRGCWDEEYDELAMAFFPLFLFLLLLCFPVGCCFVAPLEEKELLRRKWLLLLWSSGKAGLKRSCWIVGENLVVLGGSRRCLTVVRKVAVYFQTVEGESRERGYRSSLPLCFPP